ncbi:MAG TPA: formylmethanofuran dehydrogenase [Methylotenera sp.]|nr:formylmethanofuran dehydrogenase [Methylotenera sp.]
MDSAHLNATTMNATCPACGLLCDDVQIVIHQKTIQVRNQNCSKSQRFFEQPQIVTTPKIAGKPASLQAAIQHAAQLLKAAKAPLFAGLSTDILGFRTLFNLAQKTNAAMQHINAQSTQRNLRVLQSAGWQTTTLTEVKHRADVLVCFGTDIVTHNPRFFERFIWVKDALFCDANQRDIIYIGENINTSAGISPTGNKPTVLACNTEALPEVTAAFRALIQGKTLKCTHVAGIPISALSDIATKLKQAKYGVLAWVAKDLDFPHAELTIQNITESAVLLNQTTRAASLALGGSDGDTSISYAHTWLSGVTLNDAPIAHDCMVWVNSYSPAKLPKDANLPLIALGQDDSGFEHAPDVFIPVATPGLDCNGTLFRVDGSVTLPLKKCREATYPTLSAILSQIEAQL